MSDPNNIISKTRMVLGLSLGIAALIIGGLFMFAERAVILTQRFAPDAVHNLALELKGKIFYADPAEVAEYFFYKHLFLSGVLIGFVFILLNFMWEGYRKMHMNGLNAKDQK